MRYRIERVGQPSLPCSDLHACQLHPVTIAEHRALEAASVSAAQRPRIVAVLHPEKEDPRRCALREAVKLLKRWSGFGPRWARVERIRPMRALVDLGEAVAILYASDKWDRKRRFYVHEFRRGTRLRGDPFNPGLLLIRGQLRIRSAGIVG